MKDLKVIFMGTPDFAVPILEELIKQTNVVLVVSKKDAPVGRKQILTSSPIKKLALENNIEVFTPNKIREEYDKILNTECDIIITCAYGQIIPKEILEYPRLGCINVHASLLPKLRGGAPIQYSLLNGDDKTGITIMYMDEKMDNGNIISKSEVTIEYEDNLETLSNKLSLVGRDLLIKTLPSIINHTNDSIPQNLEEVTFAPVIKKDDELLDFSKTALEIYNKIRAFNPNPGAYFILNGNVVKVYKARINEDIQGKIGYINNIYKDGIGIGTKNGEIVITLIKPASKNMIEVKDYLNGIKKEELIGKEVNK